jgi:hypothetical protein
MTRPLLAAALVVRVGRLSRLNPGTRLDVEYLGPAFGCFLLFGAVRQEKAPRVRGS